MSATSCRRGSGDRRETAPPTTATAALPHPAASRHDRPRDERLPRAYLQREGALCRLRQSSPDERPIPSGRAGRAARGRDDRVRPRSPRLAAVSMLPRNGSIEASPSAELRLASCRGGADAHAGPDLRAPQSASRGSSRRGTRRRRPPGSEVVSPSRNARRHRCVLEQRFEPFTIRREPISPNGFDRSPAVVIGTSAYLMPRSSPEASSACVREPTARPTRISTGVPHGLTAEDAPRGRMRTTRSEPARAARPSAFRASTFVLTETEQVPPHQHRSPWLPRPPASCARSAGGGACSRSAW